MRYAGRCAGSAGRRRLRASATRWRQQAASSEHYGKERRAPHGNAHVSALAALALLTEAELFHLQLQALARNLEQARSVRHVPAGLLERPHDQLALEPAHGRLDLLLQAVRRPR